MPCCSASLRWRDNGLTALSVNMRSATSQCVHLQRFATSIPDFARCYETLDNALAKKQFPSKTTPSQRWNCEQRASQGAGAIPPIRE